MAATGEAAYILANYQVVVDVAQRDRYSYEPLGPTVFHREENRWAGLFALPTDVVSIEDDDAKFPYMASQAAAATIGRRLEGMGTQMRYGGPRLPALVTQDGFLAFELPGTAAWHGRYGRMCAGSTSSSSPVVVKLSDRAPSDGEPREIILAAKHSDFGAYHAARHAVVPRGRAGCKPLTRWDFKTIRPSEMDIDASIFGFLINNIKGTPGGDVKVKECEFATMLAHDEHWLTFGLSPRSPSLAEPREDDYTCFPSHKRRHRTRSSGPDPNAGQGQRLTRTLNEGGQHGSRAAGYAVKAQGDIQREHNQVVLQASPKRRG